MKILGITSALKTIGAAIIDEMDILSESSISGKISQSEKLISLVDNAIKRTRIKPDALDAVAVTIGPGSYSGLRGGLATAKALVSALNIPIISVSTLYAVAYNFINSDQTVVVAINAMREEYNLALFGANQGQIKRLTDDLIVKSDRIFEVLLKVKGRIMLASDENLYKKIKNQNIMFAEAGDTIAWARNVAMIGLEKLKKNETEDYLSLTPSYSHSPNIREFKK